jgi:uncharacterized protein YaeQ
MALRATIYKIELNVADMSRHHYATYPLTVARHPSETDERMMVRLLAFALNAHEDLNFTKGISDADEPDLWQKDLTGVIQCWVEVGQPDDKRLLKAAGKSDQVKVYCFGGAASRIWWEGMRSTLARSNKFKVFNFDQAQTRNLAKVVNRNMIVHITIEDSTLTVIADDQTFTIGVELWALNH